jgi:hypothetical protein
MNNPWRAVNQIDWEPGIKWNNQRYGIVESQRVLNDHGGLEVVQTLVIGFGLSYRDAKDVAAAHNTSIGIEE